MRGGGGGEFGTIFTGIKSEKKNYLSDLCSDNVVNDDPVALSLTT